MSGKKKKHTHQLIEGLKMTMLMNTTFVLLSIKLGGDAVVYKSFNQVLVFVRMRLFTEDRCLLLKMFRVFQLRCLVAGGQKNTTIS